MSRNKYTKELLESVVVDCVTMAEVCRRLGTKPATGSQTHIARKCREFGVDTSHFLGQGHNKGKVFDKKPLEFYLTKNSRAKSDLIRRRLISEGLKKARCEKCGLDEWLSEPIPLELDHINSDHWDNRIENLQIVCPNCHAQETAGRRNTRKNTTGV